LIQDLQSAQKKLAEELASTEDELNQAQRALSESSLVQRFSKSKLISRNPAMLELFRLVERLKDTELSVVLWGESGTGKELIARSLHRHSRRAKAPFIAVNCAALPANLIESELFGFKAGAFTGAMRDRKGLIREAEGGTLFLDEIAELELPLQAKLLRVLQEKEVTPLGETRPIPVNFRLLSASHRRLKEQADAGKFREDLFYRVSEVELYLPPLRERKEDVPLLAETFIKNFLEEQGDKGKARLGQDFLKTLIDYPWPGNIRELENVIRVATALRQGAVIGLKDIPQTLQMQLSRGATSAPKPQAAPKSPPPSPMSGPLEDRPLFDPQKTWDETELLVIAKALLHFEWDVKKAATALDCAATKLYQRMREHDLETHKDKYINYPYRYESGKTLKDIKKEIFEEALRHCQHSPYQTARLLKVSAGMVYQWITLPNPAK